MWKFRVLVSRNRSTCLQKWFSELLKDLPVPRALLQLLFSPFFYENG